MKAWIENVSMWAVQLGHHRMSDNCMLIQIVDPDMEFPTPYHKFTSVHGFKFLDLERDSVCLHEEWKISEQVALSLVECLQTAIDTDQNVIVHCVAGVCRSGAVCEVGALMGLTDTGTHRIPNIMVKTSMMKVLKLTYD